MKKNKILKGILKWISITIGVLAMFFVVARYGWRMFGFQACDSITVNWVEDVKFLEDEIVIDGGTLDSFSSFVGYKYEINDENLYLGVKHNLIGGFFNRLGGFHIVIKADSSKVKNIYLKSGKEERLIWNVDQGRIINQIPDENATVIYEDE